MPPEMMTKVCPIASSSGATAKTAIERTLYGLTMKLEPSAIRAQASKPTTSRIRNTQARAAIEPGQPGVDWRGAGGDGNGMTSRSCRQ